MIPVASNSNGSQNTLAGGETALGNLLLLCTRHHRLVHEGGFRLEKDYRDRWFFQRPDGRAVPSCGYRPEDIFDEDVYTSAEGWQKTSAEGLSMRWHKHTGADSSVEAITNCTC